VNATVSNGSVLLTWSAPSNNGGSKVTGYAIYRSQNASSQAVLATVVGTSYTDASTKVGIAYIYTVVAMNAAGESPLSAEASATPRTTPGAPTGLEATVSNKTICLSWSAPSGDGGSAITGYAVYRGLNTSEMVELATVTGTSYADTSAQAGQTYYYKVVAVNTVGAGEASVSASAVVEAETAPGSGLGDGATFFAIAAVASILVTLGVFLAVNRRKN
jgi:fibronectin type 3 domain-containing protein